MPPSAGRVAPAVRRHVRLGDAQSLVVAWWQRACTACALGTLGRSWWKTAQRPPLAQTERCALSSGHWWRLGGRSPVWLASRSGTGRPRSRSAVALASAGRGAPVPPDGCPWYAARPAAVLHPYTLYRQSAPLAAPL